MTPLDRARPWLEAALNRDQRPLYTMAEVEALLNENKARLWTGERSCMLTQLDAYASGEMVLDVWLAGGDLADIMAGRPHVEQWAKEAGATQILIAGRRGWERVLEPHGFTPLTTTLRKILA